VFDIGFLEILVVAIIGLLVLGPERLPQVIKKAASWTARSRHFASHLKEEFEREANLSEMRETLTKEKEQFRNHLKKFEEEVSDNTSESVLEKNKSEESRAAKLEKNSQGSLL